jgi:uncharacterized protein (TIGR02453 family)
VAADPTAGLRFAGFPAAAFAWFAGLEADNGKAYFTAHRDTYERDVRGALEALLEELCDERGGGRVKLFRQHRDVRFSADKSPYKTTTYGLIADRPESHAGLYAQLSSAGLFAGTGYHVLAPDQLARFRAAVVSDEAGPALAAVVDRVRAGGVQVFGQALKTAPRGFDRGHPRVELLRHKLLAGGAHRDPGARGIGRDDALEHCRATWDALAPLNRWLDEHVGPSELPPEQVFGRGRRR